MKRHCNDGWPRLPLRQLRSSTPPPVLQKDRVGMNMYREAESFVLFCFFLPPPQSVVEMPTLVLETLPRKVHENLWALPVLNDKQTKN